MNLPKPLTPFRSTDPRCVDTTPKCDKCGAPVTTGAMAILCPHGTGCAFRDESNAESVDFFREVFGAKP